MVITITIVLFLLIIIMTNNILQILKDNYEKEIIISAMRIINNKK